MFLFNHISRIFIEMCKMLQKTDSFIWAKVKNIRKGGALTCLTLTTIICVVPLLTAAFIIKFYMGTTNYYIINIDTGEEPLNVVNEKFLSLGLDSTVITNGFRHFNMSDPKLIKMIKYLSPAYIRIGGNEADRIIFSEDTNGSTSGSTNQSESYTLAASDWLKLNNLARNANISIIYDLNALLRNGNGSWNSNNAEEMISFSQKNGLVIDWELGNEPNSYPHKFNTSVNGTQLGHDYVILRNKLDEYSLYKSSLLIGPSVTRLRTKEIENYLENFLTSGSEAVSAITFHHYYFSGQNATWEEFLKPTTFDYLDYCISIVKNVVNLFPTLNKPLWLGETSSAWHGGAPNLSDRFIGSFLWIDKLGLSAKLGIDVVVRQSLFKDNYALLNDSYYPNPDWWISVLYKKLVSPKVVATETEGDSEIRLYAHCARENSTWGGSSSVVVFGVNLSSKTGYIQVRELRSDANIYVFELTSEDDLFSQCCLRYAPGANPRRGFTYCLNPPIAWIRQFVRLNGKSLQLGEDLKLPDFKPVTVPRTDVLEMPPYSIVFWVFANTNARACV